MYDGIALADVAKELVAQSLAFRSTFYKACYVDNLTGCGNYSARMDNLGELGKSLVGNCYHTKVWLYCAEREIGCLSLCARQTVEKCGLAHVGQSHNTTF